MSSGNNIYAILVSWFTFDPRFAFVDNAGDTLVPRSSHVISLVSVLACEQASGGRKTIVARECPSLHSALDRSLFAG